MQRLLRKNLQIRMSSDEMMRVRETCVREEITMSALVRFLLQRWLRESHEANNEA